MNHFCGGFVLGLYGINKTLLYISPGFACIGMLLTRAFSFVFLLKLLISFTWFHRGWDSNCIFNTIFMYKEWTMKTHNSTLFWVNSTVKVCLIRRRATCILKSMLVITIFELWSCIFLLESSFLSYFLITVFTDLTFSQSLFSWHYRNFSVTFSLHWLFTTYVF